MANFTGEAERVPVVVHGFDDSSNDELAALSATGCVQDIEVMLTVLPSLKLVKDGILSKGLEALCTNEATLVPDFASCDIKR